MAGRSPLICRDLTKPFRALFGAIIVDIIIHLILMKCSQKKVAATAAQLCRMTSHSKQHR